MKHFFLTALISLLIFSCNGSDDIDPNCSFLINAGFSTSINLNLPQFSQLQFASNSVFIPNVGNQGVIVTNIGSGFFAWDASDPNHELRSCSRLSISGLEGTCGCEEANTYSLVNGQPLGADLPCGLLNYRVQQEGSTLFISN